MKIIIHLFFSLYCINTFSQTKENKKCILFNSLPDTIVTLNEPAASFEINTNFDNTYKTEVFHIRENKLISSMIFTSTNFRCNYTRQPLTHDLFFVQIISSQSDSIIMYKRFHIINTHNDNITKLKTDSLKRCTDSIHPPYTFAFNVFINDKKTTDYEVHFFRTFKTTHTSEYSSKTIYSDSIAVKRISNLFYLSEKCDSVAILINIGKSGKFFYEITNPNFQYGASLYFAVSTNDKKLNKKYSELVRGKNYSELRQTPYLSIVKGFGYAYYHGKKHSVLYINSNEKCNRTEINYDFRSEWYSLKDLK